MNFITIFLQFYTVISEICHSQTELTIEQTNESDAPAHDENSIYELCGYANRLMIRRKNKISIFDLDNRPHNSIDIESSEIPFVSATIIQSTNNTAATCDANQCLTLWDITANSAPISIQTCTINKSNHTDDNWSRVQAYKLEPHIMCHTNRKEFQLFDSRCKIIANESIIKYNFRNLMEQCEQITCINCSAESNIIYLSTTHKLFAIDVRSMNVTNIKLLKWNHLMKTPPMFIDTVRHSDRNDMIVIAGQQYSDIRIFETNFNDQIMHSEYLPYKPLNIYDSYDIARTYGQCLDPLSCVRAQTNLSNVGLCFYHDNNTSAINLLIENSAGNIFQSIINDDENKYDDDDDQKIQIANYINDWDQKLIENNRMHNKPMVTTITNFKSMIDVLRFDIQQFDNNEPEPVPLRPKQKWERSVKELSKYTDVLASDILSLWEIDDDPELKLNLWAPNAHETVNQWLCQSENQQPLNDTKIEYDTTLPEITIDDIQEQLPDLIELQEKRAEKKRLQANKRKYVPGF